MISFFLIKFYPSVAVYDPLCGNNWEREHRSQICYLFNPHPSTWSAARSFCQTMGGDLLSINSLQEHYFISGSVFRVILHDHIIVLYSVLLFIVDSVALSEHEQYYFSIDWFSKSLRISVCEQILVVRKRSHSFGALPQIFENLKVYSKNSKAIWTSCSFTVHVLSVCIESLFSHATFLSFFF